MVDTTVCKSLITRMTVISFTELEEMTGRTNMMKEDTQRSIEVPVLQVIGTEMTSIKITVTIGHTVINNEM